ncbi:hypothetical protein [Streptomyces wedmorensis]|uniref:hypothetical protein n=1 Tax=Streptomyces wedmorensis TaxID=43759 RepID=UPI00099DB3D5|nr:hypothetical protein [Streptomyces wedmorensis]
MDSDASEDHDDSVETVLARSSSRLSLPPADDTGREPVPEPAGPPSKLVLTWTNLLLNALGTFTGLTFSGVIRWAAARAPPAVPNARPEVTMCQVT